MAVKFSTSNLGNVDYNEYSIKSFAGVDYTTTPTQVNDSRAINISNYIPVGNALHKRNGWSLINHFKTKEGIQLVVQDIWQYKEEYIIFGYKGSEGKKPALFRTNKLQDVDTTNENEYEIIELSIEGHNYPEDCLNYSYGIVFEDRLFILAMGMYLVYNKETKIVDNNVETIRTLQRVKDVAYIPTVYIGLGDTKKASSISQLEEFNLLSQKCYIEIVNYNEVGTYEYDLFGLDNKFKNSKILSYYLSETNATYDIDNTLINDTGQVIEGFGKISIKDINGTKKLVVERNSTREGNIRSDKVLIQYEEDNSSMVEQMRFGIPFGSYGYRDRLFLSGSYNKKYQNIDIHSCDAGEGKDNWLDYTYFGDLSYQTFGSSEYAITGYGILNNGSMAIFKQTSENAPNLYFRTYELYEDTSVDSTLTGTKVYKERFPIIVSGLNIGNDTIGQIINYGNDLLINSPKGILKVSAGTSTASQTYLSQEMSYMIRDNLGKDLEGSCFIVYDNKLYISRKDYNGNVRIYVADENRYTYINEERQYEWWVLDGINAKKFLVLDDTLCFIDDSLGLCQMSNYYFDSYDVIIPNVKISDKVISSEVFYVETSKEVEISADTNLFYVSKTSSMLSNIMNATDVKHNYELFKENTEVSFGNDIICRMQLQENFILEKIDNNNFNITIFNKTISDFDVASDLEYNIIIKENDNLLELQINKIDLLPLENISEEDYISGNAVVNRIKYTCELVKTTMSNREINSNELAFVIPSNTKISINELYTENEKGKLIPFSKCKMFNFIWYDNEDMEIGLLENVYFNIFDLRIQNVKLDFELLETLGVSDVKFYYNVPIDAYWYGKYTSLGDISYLKTANHIIFVPDVRKGGYTRVGYRTAKSDVDFLTQAATSKLDFNYIDFDNFNFGEEDISRTYSSKKKIKNFSFMQLKFVSSDERNSTLVELTIRYKYTKINKGVK